MYVRKLRDAIYGPSSDKGWNACKENWMKYENTKWLEQRVAIRFGQKALDAILAV